jgi:hypothetical protein
LDETVYHYTSAEGLRGIVTSGEIWLTNAAFVNDTTECRLFWEVAAPVLRRKPLSNPYVQELLDRGRHPKNDAYYIASFSRQANSLQQYRAYGSFCIGFDPCRMSSAGINLYECVYTEQAVKEWIQAKSRVSQWDECSDAVKGIAAYHLLFAAEMKYKSGHYSNEREVRTVSLSHHTWEYPNSPSMYEDDPPIHFRDHPVYRMPVPYVKSFISSARPIDDSPSREHSRTETASQMKRRKVDEETRTPRDLLPITEVWIGPMARQHEARLASEIVLRDKGYEHVVVKVADVPYRGV